MNYPYRCSCTTVGSAGEITLLPGERVVKSDSGLVVINKKRKRKRVKCERCGSEAISRY